MAKNDGFSYTDSSKYEYSQYDYGFKYETVVTTCCMLHVHFSINLKLEKFGTTFYIVEQRDWIS